MQIIRPQITLLVLCSVGLFAWLIMLLFPKEGIMIGGLKIRFSAPSAIKDSLQERKIEDVEKFLAQFDSLQIESASVDSIHADTTTLVVSRKENIASLQFKDGDSSPLFPFFEALDSAKANGKKVHIFHYGDSQIESDRMSNVIRLKLQEKFGGNGPGLIAPVPVTASANIGQSQSENWKRYTAYGFDNGKANHNNYGILCAFGRFTDAKKISDINLKDTTEAWIELRPTSMAVGTCKLYNEAILYFGNVLSPFILTVMSDDAVLSSEIIPAGTQLSSRSWNLSSVPKN